MENLFWFFVLRFAPPKAGNFSANNGTSRQKALEWSFPSGTRARKKQLLNKCTDVPNQSRPNVLCFFISDK